MSGLNWKCNKEEILERRRRFFRREMQDGILASFSVARETQSEWRAFEDKWGRYQEGETRPFPSNEEIFERSIIGLEQRGRVEDDDLPVIYSILDAGESMVGGMFGMPMVFFHRPRGAAYSKTDAVLNDYKELPQLSFSLKHNSWASRFLSIQEYFEAHAEDRLAQHPCLTMDALNFAVEIRGATRAYLDLYEYPDELKQLMEIGLDFNRRFQEAQMERIPNYEEGSFIWLAGWTPFPRAISLSVDAYVICSVEHYLKFGFEYQSRLIQHFGHGLMHFHCHRSDLAAEVAKLPALELFQFSGSKRDELKAIGCLPEIRRAVGDIPIQLSCVLQTFTERLTRHSLLPNVWYLVTGGITIDEANRLMEQVRSYRV